MCCAIVVLFALGPRAAILVWWLFDQLRWAAAFDTFIWPFLGSQAHLGHPVAPAAVPR
jgi:hypothetical protein